MGYVYVPEKWRKKFKVGQTVWYLDHFIPNIKKGIFVRYEPYEREYSDSVIIQGDYRSHNQIMESWTFTKKEDAQKCLRSYVIQQLASKKNEIKRLEKMLQ